LDPRCPILQPRFSTHHPQIPKLLRLLRRCSTEAAAIAVLQLLQCCCVAVAAATSNISGLCRATSNNNRQRMDNKEYWWHEAGAGAGGKGGSRQGWGKGVLRRRRHCHHIQNCSWQTVAELEEQIYQMRSIANVGSCCGLSQN